MFEKEVVIDGKGHILGRLAATVAKELLCGQKVVIVRAEEVLRTGDLHSNRLIYMQFLRKRKNTNPKKGPFHFRSPSKILWRVIRGMLPHKIARGAQALEHLKIFEGVPSPYDKKKRVVIPNALKVVTCKGDTPVTNLGELAATIGWRHCELIQELEEKRKVKSAAYWQKKKEKLERLKKAQESLENTTLKPILTTLSQYGFA